MAQLRNLPERARLLDLFRTWPEPLLHLNPFAQSLMRGPSPLSPGERELIAAYVSALNACRYCFGVHARVARAFGVPEDLLERLADDPDTAPVDERLRPLLAYVRKLTLEPARVADRDAEAVRAAGWDDEALFTAIAVCAYFNMMNRLVEGAGVEFDPHWADLAADRLARSGYTAMRAAIADEG